MTEQPLALLRNLLNLPDLIILGFLLCGIALGYRHGFLRTLFSAIGRVAALAAATYCAKAGAPLLAQAVVTPIVGEVFRQQAAQAAQSTNDHLSSIIVGATMNSLQTQVTQKAVQMAESVAFLALLTLLSILFMRLTFMAVRALRTIARMTPFGFLDAAAGGTLGAVSALVLLCLLLIGVYWFSPITYTPLGLLSPARVESTVLLRYLINILPIFV